MAAPKMAFDARELASVQGLAQALAAGDPAALPALRSLRWNLAAALLDGSADPEAVCAVPGAVSLAEAGLTRFPAEPAEAVLAGQAAERFAEKAPMLAALLLTPPQDLPEIPDLAALSPALRAVVGQALLVAPALFSEIGESESYAAKLEAIVASFHAAVVGHPEDPSRLALGLMFAQRASLLMAYFSTRNLKRMMRLRGEIVETMLVAAHRLPAHAFGERRPGPLRVGVLTQALRPFTETYLAISQFEAKDSDIELSVYTIDPAPGPIEDLAREKADRYVVLGGDLAAQLARLRQDDLDALAIHSNISAVVNPVALLAACRLARVQIVSTVTPTTGGFAAGDAYFSGADNEPGEYPQSDYVETLYRAPGFINYYAFQHDTDAATAMPTRAALGLPDGAPVFFSGANFFKLGPELTSLWARLLAEVPEARLVIMPFAPSWSASYFSAPFFARIEKQFGTAGVSRDRWCAVPPVPTRADLHRIAALCDVYIDAHPFSGACSLIDPLSVGLPIVTLAGARFRGHVGAAMLTGAGLGEFVAKDEDDYVAKAAALARDPEFRAASAAKIRDAMSPSLPYFDVAASGSKLAQAAKELTAARGTAFAGLRAKSPDALIATILHLAEAAKGTPLFRSLTDLELVRLFAVPYLKDAAPGGHAIDVGACLGETALPFLDLGWSADLFEPDTACAPAMAELARRYGERIRHHAMLVTEASGAAAFFQAEVGLSGRSPSLLSATKDMRSVPASRLDDFAAAKGLTRVDWLKVDCEGYDFDALLSHDYANLSPRLALAEFSTAHPRQAGDALPKTLAAMRERGYGALLFSYEDAGNFHRRVWDYWCIGLTSEAPVVCAEGHAQGNILFFRLDDVEFLARTAMTLAELLTAETRANFLE
jgi:FkbM family methyltransferase